MKKLIASAALALVGGFMTVGCAVPVLRNGVYNLGLKQETPAPSPVSKQCTSDRD